MQAPLKPGSLARDAGEHGQRLAPIGKQHHEIVFHAAPMPEALTPVKEMDSPEKSEVSFTFKLTGGRIGNTPRGNPPLGEIGANGDVDTFGT